MEHTKTIINNMITQAKEVNAANVHLEVSGGDVEAGFVGVLSVYHNQVPAHKVLDELYEWAEKNNQEVAEMIRKLEKAALDK